MLVGRNFASRVMVSFEMKILERLAERNEGRTDPFLISSRGNLAFSDIERQQKLELSEIKKGDVVALIGDFDGPTIAAMLELLDRGVVLMPLTEVAPETNVALFADPEGHVVGIM